jgi:hypothetical protein
MLTVNIQQKSMGHRYPAWFLMGVNGGFSWDLMVI